MNSRAPLFADLYDEIVESVRFVELDTLPDAPGDGRNIAWDSRRQPGGGHYAIVFLRLIEAAELRGEIEPGRSLLVETTTGTAGRGLAEVARRLGYAVRIFMPEPVHVHRGEALQALLPAESELVLTPKPLYVAGTVKALRAYLVESNHAPEGPLRPYALNHSRQTASIAAFEELLSLSWARASFQKETSSLLSKAVAALGNGTFSTAFMRFARTLNADVVRIGVEPWDAPTVWVRKFGTEAFTARYGSEPHYQVHQMPGAGGWNVTFPFLDPADFEDIHLIRDNAMIRYRDQLQSTGLSVGNSSAACLLASISPNPIAADADRIRLTPLYESGELYGP
jgi:cysteine synthase